MIYLPVLLTIQLAAILRVDSSWLQDGCSSSEHHIHTTATSPEEITSLLVFLFNFQKHFFSRSTPSRLPLVSSWSELGPISPVGCQEFGSSFARQLCSVFHETGCEGWMGQGDLLPRWLIPMAVDRRPRFHRLLQWLLECLHGTAAGFSQNKQSKRPRQAFVTQPQRPHTIFPAILFRSHWWALTGCERG